MIWVGGILSVHLKLRFSGNPGCSVARLRVGKARIFLFVTLQKCRLSRLLGGLSAFGCCVLRFRSCQRFLGKGIEFCRTNSAGYAGYTVLVALRGRVHQRRISETGIAGANIGCRGPSSSESNGQLSHESEPCELTESLRPRAWPASFPRHEEN